LAIWSGLLTGVLYGDCGWPKENRAASRTSVNGGQHGVRERRVEAQREGSSRERKSGEEMRGRG